MYILTEIGGALHIYDKDFNLIIKVEDKRDLYFCDTARLFDSMCGLEGKKFESKN